MITPVLHLVWMKTQHKKVTISSHWTLNLSSVFRDNPYIAGPKPVISNQAIEKAEWK